VREKVELELQAASVSVEAQGRTGGGHAAAPELALEAVAIAKGIGECGGRHVGHDQALRGQMSGRNA